MGDRYRYARPRSPVNTHPARASLPINVYSASAGHDHHLHVVPTSRREITSNPRSSVSSISTGPVTTTTYKITSDPPTTRASNLRDSRESSRTRSSTLDSRASRPTVITTAPRTQLRPVIHSAVGGRPASPLLKNPYRSSDEEYYAIPASSKHGHGHHHHKRYSGSTDSTDLRAREREAGRLMIGTTRVEPVYMGSRARPLYAVPPVRHADTVSADYGDNGYGYTNPRDLVQYDLNNTPAPRHHARRDSFDGGRTPRPSSVTSYQDLHNSRAQYDARERGPPPSTRGFDRIQPRGATWEQPAQVQMPTVVPIPPMDPIRRPAPFEPEVPRRKESLTRRDRASVYHNEPRRGTQRDDYYEARDDDRRDRPHRHERREDPVEQRGFGIRPERSERAERVEKVDRGERSERSPPSDRDRQDYKERRDHKEQKEHSGGKDAIAAGISIAGAALGVNALRKTRSHDDRNEHDEPRRRRRDDGEYEHEDEHRRRREPKDERESVELGGREPKERRRRESELPPPGPGFSSGREVKPEPPVIDLKGRDPKERHHSRDERPREDRSKEERPRDDRLRDERARDERPRDERPRDERSREERPRDDKPRDERPQDDKPREERRKDERDDRDSDRERERSRRHRSEASIAAAVSAATGATVAGAAIDSREDSSASDENLPRARREPRHQRESGPAPAPFNPKDTMDLKALKEALNRNSAPAPKELVTAQGTPRQSSSNDARALADVRTDLKEYDRSREPSIETNKENRQLRVVSPPREKSEEKPVKGILRQPREKFPEDPSPIREGVAPLKDAKKDGVPPDARWTKISRKLVNPAALELGKERFEERDDFVIVLRVLSRDEVQGYAEVTETIRANREEFERQERRRARREGHEQRKKERRENGGERRRTRRTRSSESESDTTDDSGDDRRPKMLEGPKPVMSGGLGERGDVPGVGNNLREDPNTPGVYSGYTRNPPASTAGGTAGRKERE